MSGTPPAAGPRGASATGWTRGLRLACGLILLTYVVTHLANHSLGLVSLDAMEASRRWFLALWRSPVGTVALYGAVLTHVTLALWALFVRRHLRIPAWGLVRLTLGLSIPLLLAEPPPSPEELRVLRQRASPPERDVTTPVA